MYTSIESFPTVFATVLTRAFPTRTLSFFAMDREEKKFVRVQTEGCELGYELPVLLLQDFLLSQLGLQNVGTRSVPTGNQYAKSRRDGEHSIPDAFIRA